jgi:hypothetical protein
MHSIADSRIPVVFAASSAADPADALLVEARGPMSAPLAPERGTTEVFATSRTIAHPAACACCTPRNAVREALGRLFLARVRGAVPFFRRVIAVTSSREGEEAVRHALTHDAVTKARFRLG